MLEQTCEQRPPLHKQVGSLAQSVDVPRVAHATEQPPVLDAWQSSRVEQSLRYWHWRSQRSRRSEYWQTDVSSQMALFAVALQFVRHCPETTSHSQWPVASWLQSNASLYCNWQPDSHVVPVPASHNELLVH